MGMNAWRPEREYAAFGRRRNVPRSVAPGLLAQLAIERIAVAPETPVEKLLAFRERHRDELALFRTKILALASSVAKDEPMEAMRERVADLHAREVAPALANLKKALKGQRIKALSEGLLKVAFLSAAPTSALVVAGMSAPTALLAGAGVSLVVAGTLYNVGRRESLQANPFAYLLAVERELA